MTDGERKTQQRWDSIGCGCIGVVIAIMSAVGILVEVSKGVAWIRWAFG